MNSLTKLWGWLADPEIRGRLTFIGGGLAAVAVAAWQVYLHFSPPPAQPMPSPMVNAPVDPAAVEGLSESQKRALEAETCALNNVTRQISGEKPLPCPSGSPGR
jgi:hypothetical protein